MTTFRRIESIRYSFSSPIGESTFSTVFCRSKKNGLSVFVPYRGIYFLYRFVKSMIQKFSKSCFRPLSGNLLSLQAKNKLLAKRAIEKFSSPIGESTFSTWFILDRLPNKTRFSSPIGESTFSTESIRMETSAYMLFSSPIGESTFSTTLTTTCITYLASSFRPLSGNLLSLLACYLDCKVIDIKSFRPLSGNLLSLLRKGS